MNITYLFGAGASKNAIPIMEGLNSSMAAESMILKEQLKSQMNEIINSNKNPIVTQKLFENFIEDFDWVVSASSVHQSVDTFAKKLFIRQKFNDLHKLKSILSAYFIIVQSKCRADERYDSFFASILEEDHLQFPNNLKILSWNYDFQFEKAFSEYSGDDRLVACARQLRVYSKNTKLNKVDAHQFGIFKLNGTAAFMLDYYEKKVYQSIDKLNQVYGPKVLNEILLFYNSLRHDRKTKDTLISSVSFAWEEYNTDKTFVNKAIEFTLNTDILVVIGYSFPFFNRRVDRDIIRSMENLKRVYFQAPDAENLRERFLAIRSDISMVNLLIRTDTKQFVFPNEF